MGVKLKAAIVGILVSCGAICQTGLKIPLTLTQVPGISSSWPGEGGGGCSAAVVVNTSVVSRSNNYHAVSLTSGSGVWSATINFSDTSCSGPWTSFGSTAAITQASNPAIGYGNGFHPWIQIVVTGNAVVTYAAQNQLPLSTAVGSITFPLSIPQGGTNAATAPLALANLLSGSTQGNGSKVQMAGTNSGSNGAPLCNDAGGNTTTSGCASVLPAGSQNQQLQILPNTGNTTTYGWLNKPTVNVLDYGCFGGYSGNSCVATQSPAGSITGGVNATITLAPVPLGVNWNDAPNGNDSHFIRVAGTGTPEQCNIVTAGPGTATSGSASGTLTIHCAGSHAAGFTLGPAGAGIQEAAIAAGANTALYVPPGTYNIYSSINFLAGQVIYSPSSRVVTLVRQFGGSGNLLNQPSGVYGIQASIDNSVSATGFALNLDHPNSADDSVVEDFQSYSFNANLTGHIRLNNIARVHINNITTGDSVNYAILWGPSAVSGGVLSNWISSQATANAVCLYWVSGLIDGSNWNLQGIGNGTYGIVIQPGVAQQASESTISNVTFDSFGVAGIQAVAGSGTIGGITFSDFRVAIAGIPITMNGVIESNFRNWDIAGTVANGVVQVVGGSNLNFSGFNIVSGNLGVGFNIGLGATATVGVTFCNNVIGYTTGGLPAAGFAFSIIASGASDRITICGGQKLAGVPLFLSVWSGTHLTVGEGIEGWTDTTGTITVSGGGAAAFPSNPYSTLNSATAVTSATGLWAGRNGTLINTNATPGAWTAGATIGSSCTIAQNKLYTWWFDGTKVWLTGPGC